MTNDWWHAPPREAEAEERETSPMGEYQFGAAPFSLFPEKGLQIDQHTSPSKKTFPSSHVPHLLRVKLVLQTLSGGMRDLCETGFTFFGEEENVPVHFRFWTDGRTVWTHTRDLGCHFFSWGKELEMEVRLEGAAASGERRMLLIWLEALLYVCVCVCSMGRRIHK